MRRIALLVGLACLAGGCVQVFSHVSSADGDPLADFEGCPMEGDAKAAPVRSLNLLKNRHETSAKYEPMSLAVFLKPGNDEGRFDEKTAVEVVGYVADVAKGGVETCNCKREDEAGRDTHIVLCEGPETARNQKRHVIVEITPRSRELASRRGRDYSTNALRRLARRWVRVRGNLMFDIEHRNEAVNTSSGDWGWRATCWEVHPVFEIDEVPAPAR